MGMFGKMGVARAGVALTAAKRNDEQFRAEGQSRIFVMQRSKISLAFV
jgi:hypothetical protein